MKILFLLKSLFVATLLLLSGCEKDQYRTGPSQGNSRLKQELMYNINSDDLIGISREYEYDDQGRISRTSSPMYMDGVITGTISYNLYEYNSSGQLVKIANYNANDNSPTGFINLSNTLYEYSGSGLKIKESIEFPVAGIEEYTVFEYKSNLLSQSKKYYHNNLESYSDYQYDGSHRLTKELTYSSDGKCLTYMIYSYSGSQLIKSDLYTYPDKVLYRSITRTYDEGNNLVVLESREMVGYSSAMSYIMKYIYYQ